MMSSRFLIGGLLIASLSVISGCATQLTGVLSQRGSQLEAFWSVRDTSHDGGKLWRLEATNASITEQLTRFQQQTVRVTGDVSDVANAALSPPVMRVLKIELVTQ
jgi:hypothetical protein